MQQHPILDYYASIMPSPKRFLQIIEQPLPQCVWTNTLKTTPESLMRIAEQEHIALTPLSWTNTAFRASAKSSLGVTWAYLSGLYQIQEEVSMLPVQVLAPQPGERILDLCAAPGNKTAQIAVAMQNQGTVVANDRNFARMRALGQIMKRLGLINISTTIYDGVNYPKLWGYFDKVLVDAPCSCEGTFRKGQRKSITPNRDNALRMAQVQRALLKKAIALCQPGGKIVYSTCTFAPEENERLIHEILCLMKGRVRLLPVELPQFNYCEGITQWHGETFHSSVKKTARIWPHLNNTGGFFIALLEKLDNTAQVAEIDAKVHAQPLDTTISNHLQSLTQRFAMDPHWWQQYHFTADSNRGIYLVNADHATPKNLKIDASGLFFMKTKIQFPKLSTAAAMLLGHHAKINVVQLSHSQRTAYHLKEDIEITAEQAALCTETGYVIVCFEQIPLGMALYFAPRNGAGHRLRSLFPRYLQGP